MDPRTVFLALLCASCATCLTNQGEEEEGLYVNEWAVKVIGGERVARDVAADHGFDFDGQVN